MGRHQRLRLLLKKLNKERKKQAKKTDILCNDLIGAQRVFIRKLKTISFAAEFYESIIGMADLNNLLCAAGKLIESDVPGADVAFFLRRAESFELHMFEDGSSASVKKEQIETCFTQELLDNACKANRVCTLDEIFDMDPSVELGAGLHGNPTGLHGASAVTIPLSLLGASLGVMLVYRCSDNKLATEEIRDISAIVSGLSQAIVGCQAHSNAAN
ncbi:MAG: hypothetical protein ACYTE3_26100 [Planctomycetota bacterium]